MITAMIRILPDHARPRFRGYVALLLLSVVLRAAGTVLLVPLLGALFSDSPSDAWGWLGILTAVTVAGWVTDWFSDKAGYELGFAALDSSQRDLADRLTRIKLEWFTTANTSAARKAVAATGPDLAGMFGYLFTPVFQSLVMPVALGLALLPVSPPLGVVACLSVPLLLGSMWLSRRFSRGADDAADRANAEVGERILEFARTQQALRAARRVEPARSMAGEALGIQRAALMRLLLLQVPGQVLFGAATQVALAAMAATTVVLAVRGDVSVIEAVALLVIVGRFLEPFVVLGGLTPVIGKMSALLGDITAVLAAPRNDGGGKRPAAPTATGADPLAGAAATVRFNGVSFRHAPDGPDVIDDLTIEFRPGTTAIVGPSGSGKSTVLGLIAGLYRPTAGAISVNGTDLWALSDDERRNLVSVVFQHPYLFEGTIADNVRAGDPRADEAAVGRALYRARVRDLVASLPDGAGTAVGEAGAALSGGERQRVSIARALLKPSPVLLVDEATSALDTENEAAIVAAIGSGHDESDYAAGAAPAVHATRIVVAHRLSTIRNADRVIFLDDGKIAEDGTVDELIAAGGPFARFWRHQEEARGWAIA